MSINKTSVNIEFWKKTVLSLSSNIENAIEILNDTGLKIVLVINESDQLVGTISDGDIRRGLMKGQNISSSIEAIMHRKPLVVTPDIKQNLVVELMLQNKILQIPIVDSNMKILGLHIWENLNQISIRPNKMVIMAGGKGTRLGSLTTNCPKPMLQLGSKPILEHIISRAKNAGFSHFVIAIHHLGHVIEEYFGAGEHLGVRIDYLRESYPLGTAGALKLLNPKPHEPFIVTNGVVLTDIDYGEFLDFHVENSAFATMAVRLHEWQNPYGVVTADGLKIVEYQEKPIVQSYINAGIYVFEPAILDLIIKNGPFDMPEVFELIQTSKEVFISYPIHERWVDLGLPEDLNYARALENSIKLL